MALNMASLFQKEMDLYRKTLTMNIGSVGLNTLLEAIPEDKRHEIVTMDRVCIKDIEDADPSLQNQIDCFITDEYYSALKNTNAYLWSSRQNGVLLRTKYDYLGKPMKDVTGKPMKSEVEVPSDCCAVISTVNIANVPYGYVSKQGFKTVDRYGKNKMIYIVPKRFCVRVDQAALILNINHPKKYYNGYKITAFSGSRFYLYSQPINMAKYNPENSTYKILDCTDISEGKHMSGGYDANDYYMFFEKEMKEYIRYFIRKRLIFTPLDGSLVADLGLYMDNTTNKVESNNFLNELDPNNTHDGQRIVYDDGELLSDGVRRLDKDVAAMFKEGLTGEMLDKVNNEDANNDTENFDDDGADDALADVDLT